MVSPATLYLTKKQFAVTRRTKETEVNIPDSANTLTWQDIPETIEETDDDILKKILICRES
jgi:hypothetical protein